MLQYQGPPSVKPVRQACVLTCEWSNFLVLALSVTPSGTGVVPWIYGWALLPGAAPLICRR